MSYREPTASEIKASIAFVIRNHLPEEYERYSVKVHRINNNRYVITVVSYDNPDERHFQIHMTLEGKNIAKN